MHLPQRLKTPALFLLTSLLVVTTAGDSPGLVRFMPVPIATAPGQPTEERESEESDDLTLPEQRLRRSSTEPSPRPFSFLAWPAHTPHIDLRSHLSPSGPRHQPRRNGTGAPLRC
jgi:hypothetical protein